MLSSFDRIPERDGRTERQTEYGSWFHLSSPEGVMRDNTSASDRSTPDVRSVLSVQMLTARLGNRMHDVDWLGAAFQHGKQSVGLGRWTVELVRRGLFVEPLDRLIHHPFPRPLLDDILTPGPPAAATRVDIDDLADGSQRGTVRSSIPQSRTERTVSIVVFVDFLYACAVKGKGHG